MKKLLILLLISYNSLAQTSYYVATTGNDGNPGSILQPFKTVGKLSSVMHAGDVAYIRGGTYTSVAGNGASVHFQLQNLTNVTIQNYPGETPVFDLIAVTPSYGYPFAFVVESCTYVKVKGLMIKNLKQIADGTGVSRGFAFSNSTSCTAELLNVYNIGGTGVTIINSNGTTFLNCDSHNNGDGMSPDQWNFGDGFSCTGGDASSNLLFEGCRTWMNGDDGWDFFGWQGTLVTLKNCWSFWNSVKPWGLSGTQPSDAGVTPSSPYLWASNNAYRTSTSSGEGFKLGGCNMSPLTCVTGSTTQVRKVLINCASFNNSGTGYSYNFTEGSQYSHIMRMENCAAYNNGNDGIGGCCGRNAGLKQRWHNSWEYLNNRLESGGGLAYDGLCDSMSYNKWSTYYEATPPCGSLTGITLNNSDFVSTNDSLAPSARQADGSLPELTFLHLASGSDLIDAGVNRGYVPFYGAGVDLGPFQFVSGSPSLPTANAGADQTITLPTNSITLTGSGTGSGITYVWSNVLGNPSTATITGSTTTTPTISGLIQGTYRIQLAVTSGSDVARDTMSIVVNNTGTIQTPAIFRQATLYSGKIFINFTASVGDQFTLERLVNGQFVSLNTTYQTGLTSYWVIDGNPITGTNRYRIRTDKDVYSAEFLKKK